MSYHSETSAAEATGTVTAKARYEMLEQDRAPYLQRAREASRLTIPSLLPPAGSSGASQLYRPYQSTGADGVNNLSAKLLMALFPAGSPFFRLTMDDFIIERLAENAEGEDPRAEFEAALGKIERAIVNRMEQKGSRKVNFEALQHLVVTGNGLIYVKKDGGQKFFPLDRFVVSRDLDDNVLEIIVKECISKEALPENLQEVVSRHSQPDLEGKTGQQQVEVFTWVQQVDNRWKVHQEVCGERVDGEGDYPLEKSAWIPLRWTKLAGESYGRGRCEEYLGDLYSMESGTKSILDFAAAVSKIIPLVDPNGNTDIESVARAASGDFVDGNARDITFLMVEKGQDFQVCKGVVDDVKSRLERAFLMATSIQRQAERVTAEEIRVMAGELEQGLGGVYSILSEEFQRPLVTRIMHAMSKDGDSKIPKLPEGAVSPQIVTGLDGLGRNTDMLRLDALIEGTATQFGQEAVAQYINVGAYMARRGAALGIDLTGLVRSAQEIQSDKQSAMMQEMAGKLGGPAINAMSQQALADKQMQQAAPQTTPQ